MSRKNKKSTKKNRKAHKKKARKPVYERRMPKYYYAKVKSSLSRYFRENDIDYSECGTFSSITRKCYQRIKEDWIERKVPLGYALDNIDLIFEDVCRPQTTNALLFIESLRGQQFMWWDIKALYKKITTSKYFNKEKDTAFFFDQTLHAYNDHVYLFENKEISTPFYISQLYKNIYQHNKNYKISPGATIDIFSNPSYHKPNANGGTDFEFKYNAKNTEIKHGNFDWHDEDENEYQSMFKSQLTNKQRTDVQKSIEDRKLAEEIKKEAPIPEEITKKIEEIETRHKAEIAELKNIIEEQNKRITESERKSAEREERLIKELSMLRKAILSQNKKPKKRKHKK